MESGTRKGRVKRRRFGNEVFGEIKETEGKLVQVLKGLRSTKRQDAEMCKRSISNGQ